MNCLSFIHFLDLFNSATFPLKYLQKQTFLQSTLWEIHLRLHSQSDITQSIETWVLKSDHHILPDTCYGILDK